MKPVHVLGLTILAAIWGGSFIQMRVLVPIFGAPTSAGARAMIAGLALLAWIAATRRSADWQRHWKHYVVIGAVNSAVPFVLFAFAARHLPAAYSAILNSTSPIFGVVLSAVFLSERITAGKVFGLLAGTCGVALVAGAGAGPRADPLFAVSIAACLFSSCLYAVAAVYIRKYANDISPTPMTAATQFLAGLMLVPLVIASPAPGPVTAIAALHLVMFALLNSAVAYLIYFWLIADIGPTRALTVTFLMPPFGMLFGAIFLRERVTVPMVAGCALVIAGTALVSVQPKKRLRWLTA